MAKTDIRKMNKKERWTKRCSVSGCELFVPKEHTICDYHLEQEFLGEGEYRDLSTGCDCCGDTGYTVKQVLRMLRRATGERPVE